MRCLPLQPMSVPRPGRTAAGQSRARPLPEPEDLNNRAGTPGPRPNRRRTCSRWLHHDSAKKSPAPTPAVPAPAQRLLRRRLLPGPSRRCPNCDRPSASSPAALDVASLAPGSSVAPSRPPLRTSTAAAPHRSGKPPNRRTRNDHHRSLTDLRRHRRRRRPGGTRCRLPPAPAGRGLPGPRRRRTRLGQSWRTRWDSLRLFTPAQYDGLPGHAVPRRQTATTRPRTWWPTTCATTPRASSCRSGSALRGHPASSRWPTVFVVHTSQGPLRARQVVIATGPFQRPVVPRLAAGLVRRRGPAAQRRRTASRRPPGRAGRRRRGRQLRTADRRGARRHPRRAPSRSAPQPPQLPQRFLGRDLFWWLTRLGLITKTAESRLARRMRARGDLVIGTPLTRLRRAGVTHPTTARLAPPANQVPFEDGRGPRLAPWCGRPGSAPTTPGSTSPTRSTPQGHPRHERGITAVPGLAFVGLPWQHTRGSALLGFVHARRRLGRRPAQRARPDRAPRRPLKRRRRPAPPPPHTEWTAGGQSAPTTSSHQTSPTSGARHDHHHLTGHHTRHPPDTTGSTVDAEPRRAPSRSAA